MIEGPELTRLQVRYGYAPSKPHCTAWLERLERLPVYTIAGPTTRPLVMHRGLLTDIMTGTQYGADGKCLTSWQVSLHPIDGRRVIIFEEDKNEAETETETEA